LLRRPAGQIRSARLSGGAGLGGLRQINRPAARLHARRGGFTSREGARICPAAALIV
jgi:hypothetical protein